ncbi:hypothetical protein FG39_gp113 [Escherichia phage vB_EcoS_FFH_1]|uniref:Uncharacterized protein n=1 Tax=Escherichia phage vB_EcoS_FFH_1 TaxID=1446489 RepID=A0A023MHJ8_9CAUD|nr:hypothetical protein FG39_gp113 [Escherichia phage vB_EcoS_FFH_1]AHN83532.1 hypothetical protein [Escherichia phage vB_EcoS_FFH_1]
MTLKPYIVESTCGSFHLGVDDIAEAVFAATGDYSHIGGAGYPTVIGDWVETNLDVSPYNPYCLFDEDRDEVKCNLEFVYNRVLKVYQRSPEGYGDITCSIKQYLKDVYSSFSDEGLETVAVEFNND